MNSFYRFFASVLCLVFFVDFQGGSPARARAIFNPANVVFREAVSGLIQPIFITNAADGSNRLFIVERAGRVRIFKDGSLLAKPFLDIQSLVNDSSSERGLLALAFHPNYENNGLFYRSTRMGTARWCYPASSASRRTRTSPTRTAAWLC
jgi:hypothetical protein